jgi:DNA repair protein RadC
MKISCRKLLSLTLLNDLMKYRNYVTLTQTSVYPREVVMRALHHKAAALVLAHNHPSGSVQPSRADEALTHTLKTTLALVDVKVLDHIIVGPGQALSMAEQGMI